MKYVLFLCTLLCFVNVKANKLLVPSVYSTIQEALNAAASGDTVLVASGDYSGDGFSANQLRNFPIKLISEEGPDKTVINVSESLPFLTFNSGVDTTTKVIGFTFQNPSEEIINSFVMNVQYANPIIEDCIFRNIKSNRTIINCYNSSPIISSCKFMDNTISENAHIISGFYSNISISNSDFVSNTFNSPLIELNECTNVFVSNCNLSQNEGLSPENELTYIYSSKVVFDKCAFTQNNKGIEIRVSSEAIFTNCLIAQNSSYGILSDFINKMDINNCTISNNLRGIAIGVTLTPNIVNSIIYGNSSEDIRFTGNTKLNIDYSCIDTVKLHAVMGQINIGQNMIFDDPLFVDPPSGDFHLLAASKCIGSGTMAGSPATDLENNPRPLPLSTNPDIGCYEKDQITFDGYFQNAELQIYPNPTNGIIHIEGLTKNESSFLSIYSIEGKKLFDLFSPAQNKTIDVWSLPKGAYILQIEQYGSLKNYKFLKK